MNFKSIIFIFGVIVLSTYNVNADWTLIAEFNEKINEQRTVESVSISADGKMFVVGLCGGPVNIYELRDSHWVLVKTLGLEDQGHKGSVCSVSISVDGQALATWSPYETIIKIWKLRNNHWVLERTLDKTFARLAIPINKISISADAKILVTGSLNVAKLWQQDGNSSWVFYKNLRTTIADSCTGACHTAIGISAHGQTLVLGATDGVIKILKWSVDSEELTLMQAFGAHADEIDLLSISTDGKMLVSRGENECIKIWELGHDGYLLKEELRNIENDILEEVTAAAISDDGRTLVIGFSDGIINIWINEAPLNSVKNACQKSARDPSDDADHLDSLPNDDMQKRKMKHCCNIV